MNKIYIPAFLLVTGLFYLGMQQDSNMENSEVIMTSGFILSLLFTIYLIVLRIKNRGKTSRQEENFHAHNKKVEDRSEAKKKSKERNNNQSEKSTTRTTTSASYSSTAANRKLTKESSLVVKNLYAKALQTMLIDGCPCEYPRFRHLSSFYYEYFTKGAVLNVDTNYLVSRATDPALGFLKATDEITDPNSVEGDFGADKVYTCQKCSSVYKEVVNVFNGKVEILHLELLQSKFESNQGAEVQAKFPLYQGFFGRNAQDVDACKKAFQIADDKTVFLSMVAKQ